MAGRKKAVVDKIADKLQTSLKSTIVDILNETIPLSGSSSPHPSSSTSSDFLSEDDRAIIAKARSTRLAMSKSVGRKSCKKAMHISFCKMVRGRKGGLAKVDDYVEISFSGDETYAECVHKAVQGLACEWEDEDGYDVPQICRVSGTRVLDQPLLINDEECPWTIATYVKHTFHKQTQVKLGIGMFELQHGHESAAELPAKRQKHTESQLKVWYAPNIGIMGLDYTHMKARSDIWKSVNSLSLPISCMDKPVPWYPEQSGYDVCKIEYEGTTVLNYNGSGFSVYDDKESFCVVHQSKDCVLDGPVMPLFCIASHHSSKYRYHWDNIKGNVGLYGPVLYVTKSGTYRCTVENKDNGAKCRSGSIHVSDDILYDSSGDSGPTPHTTPEGTSVAPHDVDPRAEGGSTPHSSEPKSSDSKAAGALVREFSNKEIVEATSSFSHLIGKGGFGRVYKGCYEGLAVAVKVFEIDRESTPGVPSMSTEISNLSRFRHPNLITLMGYCEAPKMLVYPYMHNKSLYHRLHAYKVDNPLTWDQRVHILHGTACGIAYLHSSHPPFIHQDIKSQNILLDALNTAKVADFGFVTPTSTNVGCTTVVTAAGAVGLAGSRGYTPPEFNDGKRSPLSDVYGYGVREEEKLVDYCTEAKLFDEKVDISACKAMSDLKAGIPSDIMAETFIKIGTKCAQRLYKKRCTMSTVIEMWSAVLRQSTDD